MRFPDQAERSKRARLITLLDDGLVTVHLDARRDGVDVPEHLRGDLMLALNLSRRFQLEEFEVGPLAVRASLSFGGERYLCVLPWRAIWRMEAKATGDASVFEDAVPPELIAAAQAAAGQGEGGAPREDAPGADETSQEAPTGADDDPGTSDEAPRRPTLRIVK